MDSMKRLTLEEIEPQMSVRYVPRHAGNNLNHPDVEQGVVSSKNDLFAFVKFGASNTGSQACNPGDLIRA